MNQFWGMYCNIAFHKALLEQELFINNLYSFNKRWVGGKEKGGGGGSQHSQPWVLPIKVALWQFCFWVYDQCVDGDELGNKYMYIW